MTFWKKILKKVAYHVAHPVLRFIRKNKTPAPSARGIVLYKDEVLLIRNIGVSHWSLPGGSMEHGEGPEEGLLRELREELHLPEMRIEYRLGVYDGEHKGKNVPVYIFVVRALSLYRKKQWEIDEACWFRLSGLPENLSPATCRCIRDYTAGLRDTKGEW